MSTALPAAILLTAFGLFAGFLVAGSSVMHGRRRERRRRARLHQVLGTHAREKRPAVETPVIVTRQGSGPLTATARLGSWFGYSLSRVHVCPVPVPALLGLTFAASLAAGWLGTTLAGPVVLIFVPLLWPVVTRTAFGAFERRRTTILFRQFPDALAMIVRGVRVGIPVGDSIRAVASESPMPTAAEFSILSDELAIGVSLEDALRALAARNGLQEYRYFATAIALQNQTGGRLSETLENLADVIRKRVAVRARGYALAAEARTSAMVLASLPFVAFAGLFLMGPGYIAFFFHDRTGPYLLAGSVGDLSAGMVIMRTLIRKALS